jgi:hypothetical protein
VARPEGGYKLADGTRVPGVTTICNVGKDAGGLIHWAWKLGLDGKDYRQVLEDAGSAGKLTHRAVEAWIRGRPYTMTGEPTVVEKGQKAFDAFLEWAEHTRLKATHPEVSIVSETYRFGGTFDALLISDKRAMGDWKSADGLYPEMLMQIAAYGHLWTEAHPEEPITGGYHLLRFDKTHGDYHHSYWPELNAAWAAFKLCLRLYDLRADLKQRCR